MQTINVRQLQRNMKDISAKVQQGESFAVFKNSDLIFQINPAATITLPKKKKHKEETTTLHDVFKNAQFNNGKNLSAEVDNIVYS